jgi:hypothetical protein
LDPIISEQRENETQQEEPWHSPELHESSSQKYITTTSMKEEMD